MKINKDAETDFQFDNGSCSREGRFEDEATSRLTARDLLNGGYRRILAFVPKDEPDGKSENAERVSKSRNKKHEAGIRQLNIQVPDDEAVRDTLKAVAAAVSNGTVSTTQLVGLLAGDRVRSEYLAQCGRVLDRGGWRSALLRVAIRL